MSQQITKQKFLNPETGKMVGYARAKTLGLIPHERVTHLETKVANFDVTTVKVNDLSFDKKVFDPIKTDLIELNSFISTDGGFLPATNTIIIGTPGVGKTTVGMDLISRCRIHSNSKVLFISGEMNRIDLYRYCKRFPQFGELDTMFLSDYVKLDPKLAIEKVLQKGYDLVLMDSWAEICLTIKDATGMSSSQAQSWILDLMEKHNEGLNDNNLFTSFLIIQQVTKSGEFLGSNRLKHMTSAMLDLTVDRDAGVNIMEYSKNRAGTVGRRISFTFLERGRILYANA